MMLHINVVLQKPALPHHLSLLYQWHILHMHRQYSELELSLGVFNL
jgi:hypothetical protein